MKTITQKKVSRKDLLGKAFAGIDIKELANRMHTTAGALYNVKYGTRQVSALRAIQIERESKTMGHEISRTVLRPDVFPY